MQQEWHLKQPRFSFKSLSSHHLRTAKIKPRGKNDTSHKNECVCEASLKQSDISEALSTFITELSFAHILISKNTPGSAAFRMLGCKDEDCGGEMDYITNINRDTLI